MKESVVSGARRRAGLSDARSGGRRESDRPPLEEPEEAARLPLCLVECARARRLHVRREEVDRLLRFSRRREARIADRPVERGPVVRVAERVLELLARLHELARVLLEAVDELERIAERLCGHPQRVQRPLARGAELEDAPALPLQAAYALQA